MVRKTSWLLEIEKEYGSLENYVVQRNKGAEPLFFGVYPFNYFLRRDMFDERSVIRTNLQGLVKDGHYIVTPEGKLEGIKTGEILYPGKSGIWTPGEILNTKHSDNGWSMDSFTIARIVVANTKV